MRSKLIIIALSTALAACETVVGDQPSQGLASVNVPVVTTADYVFDAAAPGGALAQGEAERLSGWFQGLGLGYGDTVYVDAGYAPAARAQVASIAGRYGMLVTAGAPATAGMVNPGSIRVVVARRRAEVPGCPNWTRRARLREPFDVELRLFGEQQHRRDGRQSRRPAPRPRRRWSDRYVGRVARDRNVPDHAAVGHQGPSGRHPGGR